MTGRDWTGLDGTGRDWTGLDGTGRDWTGPTWSRQPAPRLPFAAAPPPLSLSAHPSVSALSSACATRWVEASLSRADKLRKLRRYIRRAMMGKSTAAFNSWVETVDAIASMREALRKAVNVGIGRAWRRWVECVDERHRLREVAMRVGLRMMRRVQAAVVDAWVETVAAVVEAREAKLRHAVIMMSRRMVAMCFAAWAGEHATDAVQREAKMRRAVGLFHAKACTLCMRAWVDMYRHEQELKARYAAQWANRDLAAAVRTWGELAQRRKAQGFRLRAIGIRMARRTEVCMCVCMCVCMYVCTHTRRTEVCSWHAHTSHGTLTHRMAWQNSACALPSHPRCSC